MFITNAYAADAAPASGGLEMIIMLSIFAAIFYFMIYRPQAKRAKAHKNLLASMSRGDEILTSGGLVGTITKVTAENDYINIKLNSDNEIMIKKDFVTAVLPKGTLKSL